VNWKAGSIPSCRRRRRPRPAQKAGSSASAEPRHGSR
jgi:hypothetical protein